MAFSPSSFCFFSSLQDMSTNAFVVPDTAERTTSFLSLPEISFATACIRSGLPTEVPPNFNTFIFYS